MDPLQQLLTWGDQGWADELAAGFAITLQLAVCSYALGIVLGLLGVAAKRSRFAALRHAGEAYTTTFRAVPELVIISIIYFGGSIALQRLFGLFGFEGYVEVDAFLSGVVALGPVQGAYQTEVFRGALQSVPSGQHEAAAALGLTRTLAFYPVILPQVWRLALPGLSNLWMTVLKETALVSAIGLEEIIRAADLAAASTRSPFPFYSAVVVAYLAITTVSMVVIGRLELYVNRGQDHTGQMAEAPAHA